MSFFRLQVQHTSVIIHLYAQTHTNIGMRDKGSYTAVMCVTQSNICFIIITQNLFEQLQPVRPPKSMWNIWDSVPGPQRSLLCVPVYIMSLVLDSTLFVTVLQWRGKLHCWTFLCLSHASTGVFASLNLLWTCWNISVSFNLCRSSSLRANCILTEGFCSSPVVRLNRDRLQDVLVWFSSFKHSTDITSHHRLHTHKQHVTQWQACTCSSSSSLYGKLLDQRQTTACALPIWTSWKGFC